MAESEHGKYPAKGLCLPCEDYQCDAACTHDQRNMWFFSLFALSDGTRLCEGYSARKEKQFKEGTRMGLPEAPVKGEDRQRTAKDPAPRICKCVRDHMWSRLGQRAVKLDPVPVTLEAMVEKLREALRMAKSATATYPRLELPCGDFKGCECSRGRPMNFFSLFARNGDRVCGTYSRATENKFKVDVRPTFPDPPEKTEQRSTREKAPCLCIHEQGHIWKRLGERPVLLDPVPDTLEGMVEKLREALSEPDAARAGADAARAEADGVQGAALPTATPSAQLAIAEKFMAVLVSEMQEVPPASWFLQLHWKLVNARANARGKLTYSDGTVYEGEVKDGKPNGRPAPSIKREHEAPSDRPAKRNCNYGLDALANVAREVKKELCN